MKIDDSLMGVPSVRSKKTRTAREKTSASAETPSSTTSDSIEITPTSSQLSKLEEALSQLDTHETSKLDAVKQAIAEGNFQVDEEAVADALVKSSIDQLKRQGRK